MMVAMAIAAVTFTACKKDEDENKVPTVEIARPGNNANISVGETLNVKVEATDPDGTIAQVAIFIDNVEMASMTESPFEFYISTDDLTEGTKELKVVATDNEQATGEEIISINLIGGSYPPTAEFSVDRTTGLTTRKFTFDDQPVNNPSEWLWDFGDGNTSTESNPTHIYSQEGTYSVTLTLTNEYGTDTETKTDYITVYPIEMIELVTVDGGTFEMGNDEDAFDNNPVHTVTVDGFQIGKYEITNEQYAIFLNQIGANSNGTFNGTSYIDLTLNYCFIEYNGAEFISENGKENHPVETISWYGAKAFCDYYGYTLPTEAQWEYAARGGKEEIYTTYSGSNDLIEVGWYNFNSTGSSQIGLLSPNELGIYDMSGNEREWCQDWYSETYYSNNQNNPTGPDSGQDKVFRGGNWTSYAQECRVYYRGETTPDEQHGFGFRVALPNE